MRSLLVWFFLSLGVIPAHAWNWEGHKIVALIGESHLSPAASLEVHRLLSLEGRSSMGDVSSWADNVRLLKVPRQPFHTVRLPLDFTPYDPGRDCKGQNCIIAAIYADIATLSDQSASDDAKLLALKYLIHFVGDVHQPLHASKDPGTRDVVFRGKKQNLHVVWDREIIKSRRMKVAVLVGFVDQGGIEQNDLGTPVDWAMESRDIARDDIFPAIPALDERGGTRLPDDYAHENWPTVKRRLELAGLRLALTLNKAFHVPTD